ncbi:hypothetical protein [Maritimibacter sp. UBA3975]|uniref:hypothetical protein n=1 Tax=Maritimibacter sp. UBA3975 TaxID=1946833 RepID=UPI000C0B736C|nr:hypothetical protein [Maritimibacter sp. UBA3975]MAM63978.1 hypothetical protein [Maritimibacter sp.]|tara:strand:+ start:2761 stop:2994 length:234 start_codon:yes stop_codon:yes gene_type:complete
MSDRPASGRAVTLAKWALIVAVVFGGTFALAVVTGETPLLDGGFARIAFAVMLGALTLGLMRLLRLGRWREDGNRNA